MLGNGWMCCRVPLVAADKDMAAMTADDVGRYCALPPEALPEAFPRHNTAPTLALLPKSGCKGLQVGGWSSCCMPHNSTSRPCCMTLLVAAIMRQTFVQ